MNTCPKCSSTKINSYRHIGGKVWCTDCGYVIKEEGWHRNKDKLDVVKYVEEYLETSFAKDEGGMKSKSVECCGAIILTSFIGEMDDFHYEIEIKRIVK